MESLVCVVMVRIVHVIGSIEHNIFMFHLLPAIGYFQFHMNGLSICMYVVYDDFQRKKYGMGTGSLDAWFVGTVKR